MTGQRISDQDREVFTSLFGPLRRFAGVIAGPGIDPDDLLQDALVRVVQRGRLSDIDDPAAYLRTTMFNLISSHRSRKRIERAAMARHGGAAVDAADRYPSDLADLLRLSRESRAVLYLAEIEGFPYQEIGTMLGCTAAAARKRASRGRRQLRLELGLETST